MQSNKINHYLLKYGPLLFGLFWIIIPVQAHVFPESSTFNGEPGPPDVFTSIICMLVGFFFVILFLLFNDRYAIAEVKNRTIKLIQSETVIEKNWIEVEAIRMLPFIFPPVYKIKLRDVEDYLLFTNSGEGGSIIGFTFDRSEMGAIIQKKKRELNI